MDPLTAVGIACDLMQVIRLTGETIATWRETHRTGSADPSLEGNTKALSKLTISLRFLLEPSDVQAPPSEAEQELRNLASKLLDKTNELWRTLNQNGATKSQGSIGKSIKATLRHLYQSHHFRRLEKEIQGYQTTLESELITRISSSNEASILRDQPVFERLDYALQHFIISISKNQLQLSQLVKKVENDTRTILDGASRSRVLESLKYDGMHLRRSTVKEHHPETLEWAFEERQSNQEYGNTVPTWDSFGQWLRTDDQTYWVSGKPGSGKSTLMSFLLRDARTQRHLNEWSPDTLILSHFLLSSGHLLQRNTRGTYLSLLHQILDDDSKHGSALLSSLASRFPRISSKDVPDDWSQWELKKITFAAMKDSKRAICVFVDGLDELVASEIEDDRIWSLLRGLERIPKVKLCLSSRPEPRFRNYLEGVPKLQMQLLTDGDIRKYATKFLNSNFSASNRQAQQDEISRFVNLISERANGVFLWVYLVLRRLKTGMTRKDTLAVLYKRLETTPKDLYGLFQDMWDRLGEDANMPEYLSLAARYFHLVKTSEIFGSFQYNLYPDFTIAELMFATDRTALRDVLEGNGDSITPRRMKAACVVVMQNLDTCCAGLLEHRSSQSSPSHSHPSIKDKDLTDYNTHKVDFVHRSAREFLFTTHEGNQILAHDTSTTEAQLLLLSQVRMAIASLWTSPIRGGMWVLMQTSILSLSTDQRSQEVFLPQRRLQALVSLGGFMHSHLRLRGSTYSLRKLSPRSHEVEPLFEIFQDFMIELSGTTLAGQVPYYLEMLGGDISPDYTGYLLMCMCQLYCSYSDLESSMETSNALKSAICDLIRRGANLAFRGLPMDLNRDASWALGSSYIQLHSAAAILVRHVFQAFLQNGSMIEIGLALQMIHTLVMEGASLEEPMIVNITRQSTTHRPDDYRPWARPRTLPPTDHQGTLFFVTNPGYLLRTTLNPEPLKRYSRPSPLLGDLGSVIRHLFYHEAVTATPPTLEVVGVSRNLSPDNLEFRQIKSPSQRKRINVLVRNFIKRSMRESIPGEERDGSWEKLREIMADSEVVPLAEFERELVQEKILISKEDYLKEMPRLGAEQEAFLMERMREEAITGLGELGKTDI
ncbi:hypothetical protein BJ166DRAFT_519941 [Pestalotiopsis sp. NC0098]|nr:hypothetical protein BJ166DRAFT_519941 [Pestalotiopsis sp. NC0098]